MNERGCAKNQEPESVGILVGDIAHDLDSNLTGIPANVSAAGITKAQTESLMG